MPFQMNELLLEVECASSDWETGRPCKAFSATDANYSQTKASYETSASFQHCTMQFNCIQSKKNSFDIFNIFPVEKILVVMKGIFV